MRKKDIVAPIGRAKKGIAPTPRATETRFAMVKEHHAETASQAMREGKMDPPIVEFCKFVAGTKHYFTSSSCSGRILLLEKQGEKKNQNRFHRKWHGPASFEEIEEGLRAETAGEVWLKVEPFILHIGTDSLENAGILLELKNKAGVKRGGIIVTEPGKFILELYNTSYLAVPVKLGEKMLVAKEFLEQLVEEANRKMKQNYVRLEKFEQLAREMLD